jgi:lipid A 3-O-deacylase
MKKIILATTLIGLISANNINSNSYVDAASISIGESRDGIKIYRLSLRKDFKSKWLENKTGYLSGYYEGSLNYFKGKKNKIYGVALSPVFAYYLDAGDFKPFVEASIGFSYFNKHHIDNRNLSTNFLFEDRIGVGARYKNLEFSFRFMHYSNGSIKAPNDGIDIWIGAVSYKF